MCDGEHWSCTCLLCIDNRSMRVWMDTLGAEWREKESCLSVALKVVIVQANVRVCQKLTKAEVKAKEDTIRLRYQIQNIGESISEKGVH